MLPCEWEGPRNPPPVGLDLSPLQSLSSDLQQLSGGPSLVGRAPLPQFLPPASPQALLPLTFPSVIPLSAPTVVQVSQPLGPRAGRSPRLSNAVGKRLADWKTSPQHHGMHSESRGPHAPERRGALVPGKVARKASVGPRAISVWTWRLSPAPASKPLSFSLSSRNNCLWFSKFISG